jgi:hypothetical protein
MLAATKHLKGVLPESILRSTTLVVTQDFPGDVSEMLLGDWFFWSATDVEE